MLLVRLESTDVLAAGYDPDLGEMQIQFTTGRIYSYAGVPQEVYDGFVASQSKGTYVAQFFRTKPPQFPPTRIV